MADNTFLYGTWRLKSKINATLSVAYVNFTCVTDDGTKREFKAIGNYPGNTWFCYFVSSNIYEGWFEPYQSNAWVDEGARTISISTETNAPLLAWLQTNANKMSDNLDYTGDEEDKPNYKLEFKMAMDELNDVINEKAKSSGKKRVNQIVETAKTIPTLSITNDATATSGDIVAGKTAYVNERKIEGTITVYDGENEDLKPEDDKIRYLINARGNLNSFFKTSSITQEDLDYLFMYDSTKNVTSAIECFYGASYITKLDFKMDKCYNFNNFAYNCQNLKEVNLDLSNVGEGLTNKNLKFDFENAFTGDSKLKKFKILLPEKWTEAGVFSWYNTFKNCTSLELTQEEFDYLCSVKVWGHTSYDARPLVFSSTFVGCTNIKINDFKIKVTHAGNIFSATFQGCTGLTGNVQILKDSKLTSNYLSISSTFQDCTNIDSIVIKGYESGLVSMISIAQGCTNLKNFELHLTTRPYADCYMRYSVKNCYNLKTVYMDYGFWTSDRMREFASNCYSLVCFKINNYNSSELSLGSDVFTNCYHLFGTYNETYNPYALQDAYVYVPDAITDTLKSATNWSSFGTQIRPLSVFNKITINGTEYSCEYNQTWEQWLNSSYNTSGFTSANTFIANDLLIYCDDGSTTQTEHTTGFNFTNYLATTIVAGGSNFTIN